MKLKKSLSSLLIIGLISAPATIYAWSASVFNHTPYDVYVYSNGEPSPGPGLEPIPAGESSGVKVSVVKHSDCVLSSCSYYFTTNWVIQAGKHSEKIATVSVPGNYYYNLTAPLSLQGEGALTVTYPKSPGQQKRNVPYDIQLDVDGGGTNVDITVNPYPIMFHINLHNVSGLPLQTITGNGNETHIAGNQTNIGIPIDLQALNDNNSYKGSIVINATNPLTKEPFPAAKIWYELTYIGYTSKGIDGGDVSVPANWKMVLDVDQVPGPTSHFLKTNASQGSGLNLDITVTQKQTHE